MAHLARLTFCSFNYNIQAIGVTLVNVNYTLIFNSNFTQNTFGALEGFAGREIMTWKCVMRQNNAEDGGAIHIKKYQFIVSYRNKYVGNRALNHGGGIYSYMKYPRSGYGV